MQIQQLKYLSVLVCMLSIFFSANQIPAQQININRVELMPNMPSPYGMRDWKQAAIGYDSLVFDFNLAGQYLPLIWLNTNTINYPEHNSFGLNTVVGTTAPSSSEAINLIPAVVGASLSGIDKSSQNGYNFVLMSEEYFNKENGADVYLNHPSGSNWDDWWYDVMPNVFFYQLYDLYPHFGEFSYQFTKIADRWLEGASVMGGSTTPWNVPDMNYRAFNLMTMTPYASGVPEPEAAGALAWIFYNAYKETGNEDYRVSAEWCMEFLNSLTSNPSYELQLPYGVLTAARMNAELGTDYNITKMVNWCFDVGPLRQWGAMVGTWGGYDVDGLIGEVNGSNDYAFLMNTFEQMGALVPLIRYNDRFARAIGKWVLNAANNARLFYTSYLPDQNQDSEEWAHQYDPGSFIGHEALRQSQNGFSPYATGDAVSGGWGLTNLALYGSSHIGIAGGIIDTTDVSMILRLDLLKTDYFHTDAYPSYLYYNPYTTGKQVTINTGSGSYDIYDAVSNTIIAGGVTGNALITIPADAAVIAVIIPSGTTITYDLDKAYVNGIVIDYLSGQPVSNYPPRIKSLSSEKQQVIFNDSTSIYCTAEDKDGDPLLYQWQVSGGSFTGTGSEINWKAPSSVGTFLIICTVNDNNGGTASDTIQIDVSEFINNDPVITGMAAHPRKINLGSDSQISCIADDPDGDTLTYTWSPGSGTINGDGSEVTWTAPITAGNYYIACLVTDGRGGEARDSIGVSVRDTSIHQSGDLVAYYPFNGNADDESGFNNNGTVSGAVLVPDRHGNPSSAYRFDGVSDYISVPASSSLNFQNSISVNFWINVGQFYERESYPLSHGNWENRWKVSLTDRHIRWTVKTDAGTKDLDSETELVQDSLYNVTVLYDGSDYEIYVNGELDAFSTFSGQILTTSIDLMMGQVLPGNNQYNFNGVLDDIRIYNYAISYAVIQSLYDVSTGIEDNRGKDIPLEYVLMQNYPNPFNSQTNIRYVIKELSRVSLEIFDALGTKVKTLYDDYRPGGSYTAFWDGKDDHGRPVSSGVYFCRLKAGGFIQAKKILLLK